jgi:hypothetical protein
MGAAMAQFQPYKKSGTGARSQSAGNVPPMREKYMSAIRLSLCAAIVGLMSVAISPAPTRAAELGPNFPLPNYFPISGSVRDSLLQIQKTWLTDGLAKVKKARDEAAAAVEKAKAAGGTDAAAEEKLKALDKQVEDVTKELAIASDDSAEREVQTERKRLFMLNINKWINALNKAATEQMKIAILKDGAEAMTGERMAAHYSQQADDLEKNKRDPSIENWGNK